MAIPKVGSVSVEAFEQQLKARGIDISPEVARNIAKLDGDGTTISEADIEKLAKLAQSGAFIGTKVDDSGKQHQVGAAEALGAARKSREAVAKDAQKCIDLAKTDPKAASAMVYNDPTLISTLPKDTLVRIAEFVAKDSPGGTSFWLAGQLSLHLAEKPIASIDGTSDALVAALLKLPDGAFVLTLGNGATKETFANMSNEDFGKIMDAVLAANWQDKDRSAALAHMMEKCGDRIKNDDRLRPLFEKVIKEEMMKAHKNGDEVTEQNMNYMYFKVFGSGLQINE